MRQVALFLGAILLLNSCTPSLKEDDTIAGKFKTINCSRKEFKEFKKTLGVNGTAGGLTLDLYGNKTFKYKTCGALIYGNWERKNDSVVLAPNKYDVQMELHGITEEEHINKLNDDFFQFKITDKYLVSKFHITGDKKTFVATFQKLQEVTE